MSDQGPGIGQGGAITQPASTPASQIPGLLPNPGSAAGADESIRRRKAAIDALVQVGYTTEQASQIVQQGGNIPAGGPTGTAAAPGGFHFDPTTFIGGTHQTREQQLWQDLRDQMTQAYKQLWGTPPPPGYVAGAINQGENLIEFIDRERHKPEYTSTKGAVDRSSELANLLATTGLGMR